MKFNKLRKNRGFTLIELIIALSVISIITMAFFTTINSSIKHNAKNEKDIKALNIAQTEIENLRDCIKSNTDLIISDESITEGNINIIEKLVLFDENNIYNKIIVEDNIKYQYIVTLKVSREKRPSKSLNEFYLYDINIDVKAENENLSKKITTLTTKVLSK